MGTFWESYFIESVHNGCVPSQDRLHLLLPQHTAPLARVSGSACPSPAACMMLTIEQVGGGDQAPSPRRPTSVEALALASLLCIIPGDGEKRNQSLAHHPQCFTYAPICRAHRDCRAGSTDNRVSLMPTKKALED